MRKSLTVLFVLALAVGIAGSSGAQSSTTTQKTETEDSSSVAIRTATVLAASAGHVVLENQDGDVVDYEVPDGVRFNIDGRSLRAEQLKPGTKLTAQVMTTVTAKKNVTTTIRTGEVLHVQGDTVFVHNADGFYQVEVPDGYVFKVNGKPTTIERLGKGMKFTATLVSESIPEVTSERGVVSEIKGTAPAAAESAPAPRRAAASSLPAQLPSTASELPLIGLMGLFSLLMGAALFLSRR